MWVMFLGWYWSRFREAGSGMQLRFVIFESVSSSSSFVVNRDHFQPEGRSSFVHVHSSIVGLKESDSDSEAKLACVVINNC